MTGKNLVAGPVLTSSGFEEFYLMSKIDAYQSLTGTKVNIRGAGNCKLQAANSRGLQKSQGPEV